MKSLESICFAPKQQRLDRGFTQAQLAQRAGVSRAWLIGLEHGHARRAEFGKVFDVATALGLEFGLAPGKPLGADEEMLMRTVFDA